MDTSTLQGVFKTPPSSPLPTEETRKSPALAISDLNYYVQYRSAPWWRGACFRKAHVKHVLNHVNLALPAGSLTALVGSSGEYYLHVNLRDNPGIDLQMFKCCFTCGKSRVSSRNTLDCHWKSIDLLSDRMNEKANTAFNFGTLRIKK